MRAIAPTPPARRQTKPRSPRLAVLPAALAVAFAAAWASPAGATDLKVTINAIRSVRGTVHVSVYDKPETFPKSFGMLKELVVKAKSPTLEVAFPGLTPGTYAVAVFHDENGNGKFDQGFLGTPLEDYGFSNDPAVFFSAPDFKESAFVVAGDVTRVSVRLKR